MNTAHRIAFAAVASAAICLAPLTALGQEQTVKLDKQGDKIEVTIGGAPFATYNVGKDLPKPYFLPVRSAGGAIVTRSLEEADDHKHHKGVWNAIDKVNGIGYWAERGKIVNKSVDLLTAEGNPAKMRVVNHWMGDDGKPVVIETATISIYPNRLMVYDMTFSPGSGPVTFGDTKEGMFGIRVPNDLREGKGGRGHIINADGLKGSKACWGKTSAWVDYVGPVGSETHGVAIFDHPDNPRKSRYHVRDYGLFTISPFGDEDYTGGKQPKNELTLKPGETFRLRYGLYVHPGDTDEAKVGDVFAFFAKSA